MSSASTTNDPAPGSLAALSLAIFSDLLSNLTHDVVLQTHRAEKLLRTQQQQHALHLSALSSTSTATDPNFNNEPKMPPGNPLATIPTELICTRCNLPRHTQETMNMGTILTESGEKKKFCQKLPYQNIRGHDIYGNPFPNPNAAVKKGATATAKKDQGDSPASVGDEAPVKVGKGTGIVYFKCTSCDHEKIASSRYAAHLEKCLGLSGRKSSRAAMQKMSNGGSNSGSPMLAPQDAKTGSRKPSPEKLGTAKASTPAPDEHLLSTIVLATPVKSTLSSTPTAPSTVSNSTPKKKKKLGTAVSSGPDTKESTPVPSLPPPAIPVPGSAGKSAPSKEKKRKRKDEGSITGDIPAKPKKPKVQAAGSNSTPTSTPKPKPKPAPSMGSSAPLSLAPSVSPQKPPPPSSTSLSAATNATTLAKKPSKPKVPKAKSQQTPSGIPKKTVPGLQKDIIKDAAASSVTKDGSPTKKMKNPVKKKSTLPSGQSRPVIAGKSVPVVAGKTVPTAPARKTLPGSNNGA